MFDHVAVVGYKGNLSFLPRSIYFIGFVNIWIGVLLVQRDSVLD